MKCVVFQGKMMKMKVKQEEELCDVDFTDEEVIDASPTSVYFGKFDAKMILTPLPSI